MIGTDLRELATLAGPGLSVPIHIAPISAELPTDIYTPIEDMPAETQLLFDYNPVLARQMLDDAGVPVGFKMDVWVDSRPYYTDQIALLKEQWAKIGVIVEIKAVDYNTQASLQIDKTYTDSLLDSTGTTPPLAMLERNGKTGHQWNWALWSDEYYDAELAKATTELDIAERNRLCKELAVYITNECPYIPIMAEPAAHYWWPWLKNYYGEIQIVDASPLPILAYIWIDQDVKAEMGY